MFVRAIFTFFGLMVAVLSLGAVWPGFRGPAPQDLSTSNLPLTWSANEHLKWRAPLKGFGQSSPVVWDRQVYITTIEGEMCDICHVAAFDLATGKELWHKSTPNPTTDRKNDDYTSRGAPTPLADASGVIVLFEGGLVQAFTHTGDLRWQRDLKAEYGEVKTQFGLSSSPVAFRDMTILWMERAEQPYLLAVETATGKDRWKVPGLGKGTWSTPILLTVEDQQQLVCSADGLIRGFDPVDGKTLWSLEGMAGNGAPSPCAVGDGRFLIGASGQGNMGGNSAESNCLIQVARMATGEFGARFVWKAERATSSFGSPVVHRGLAYFINRQGVCYALDLETGKEVFAQRTKESLWATPLPVDDRIYIVGNKGWTTVLQAGPEFKVLAENRLWPEEPAPAQGQNFGGKNQYAVAAVPGALLIRVGDELFCVGN